MILVWHAPDIVSRMLIRNITWKFVPPNWRYFNLIKTLSSLNPVKHVGKQLSMSESMVGLVDSPPTLYFYGKYCGPYYGAYFHTKRTTGSYRDWCTPIYPTHILFDIKGQVMGWNMYVKMRTMFIWKSSNLREGGGYINGVSIVNYFTLYNTRGLVTNCNMYTQ